MADTIRVFKIFNGQNICLEILKTDNKNEINFKQSHNSRYWRWLNTLTIALLYQDSIFYIPTFADFRGRIYTATNYFYKLNTRNLIWKFVIKFYLMG